MHLNAARISNEVRRALKKPANDLRVGLQRDVEKLQVKKDDTVKFKTDAEVARKYFGNLYRDAGDISRMVERVDLEGPAPGAAAGFDM